MTIKTKQAIAEHGAQAVYDAANKALEGDYQPLAALGINTALLGEAWRIQSAAHKAMTDGERAAEQMIVNGELMRIAKTSAERVKKHNSDLEARGGKRLNSIRLKPEAAAALERIEASGESATAAINRLLLDALK